MIKKLNVYLKILLALLVVVILTSAIGAYWVNSSFLDFENDYIEKTDFKELTSEGYTFLDRNGNQILDVYEDNRRLIDERVEDLLMQMNIDEKIHLLKGSGMSSGLMIDKSKTSVSGAVGTIVPIPRLGLPTIYLSDGPAGLRIAPKRDGTDKSFYCTAFPIGTLLSSTWDTQMVYKVGNAMGKEALEYGIDVVLGPGANIHRHPFCGRNFEYYSEDPYLTGFIGAAMVNGIQSNGIGTSVKHFVANNQETTRFYNDVNISDRALREIYLKGFEIIVKESQPWTIMSSYNKVNGTHVSESNYLLSDILRKDWGFKGLVMTDWFGGNDPVAMVNAGNDLLEPGTKIQWKALIKGHEKGLLSLKKINTSVSRILKLILESKKMNNYQYNENPPLKGHAILARKSAAEGIVLLKNNETLPINKSKKIALLGVTSYDLITGGTGSGDVNEAYSISLEEGLENSGYEINPTAKEFYESHKKANIKAFVKPEGFQSVFEQYSPPEINYSKEELEKIASESDLAIITIGRNSGEGGDRVEANDFSLKSLEKKILQMTCEVFHEKGKKVIVVLNIGGVIETASWKDQPDAILLAWQGGQEGGNSITDILNGNINPSGKIPMTFPINVNDHASHKNFPLDGKAIDIMDIFINRDIPDSKKIANEDYTNYEEEIYVGYRHFDKGKLEVSYPFGYGLSYTAFNYSAITTEIDRTNLIINLSVNNIGHLAGKEVVQVYVSKNESEIDRPIKELKGFLKTSSIKPNRSEVISIKIPLKNLTYWDETNSKWVLEKGTYTLHIGNSSRDIKISQNIVL